MKQCYLCGRLGTLAFTEATYRLRTAPRGALVCTRVGPCNSRVAMLGRWRHVHGVWRRNDRDGTVWSIEREDAAGPSNHRLTLRYRDHRAVSWHLTPDDAKAHADDVTAAFRAQRLADYQAAIGFVPEHVTAEGLF